MQGRGGVPDVKSQFLKGNPIILNANFECDILKSLNFACKNAYHPVILFTYKMKNSHSQQISLCDQSLLMKKSSKEK